MLSQRQRRRNVIPAFTMTFWEATFSGRATPITRGSRKSSNACCNVRRTVSVAKPWPQNGRAKA